MDEITKLRRLLHAESAHRVQLEVGIETVRLLFAGRDRTPVTQTPRQIEQLLRAVLASGRGARQLEQRYRAAVHEVSDSVRGLEPNDTRGLLRDAASLNVPGFADWLLEQRPDLSQVIRGAVGALAADCADADD